MEIGQYTWSCQTVVLSGRDGSVSNRSPQCSFYANRIRSDESHCKPGCSQLDVEDALSNVFESNAADVTNFSIVWRTLRSEKCRRSKRGSTKCGNCEEGKKARHKSNITSFLVNNLTCNSKFWLVLFYWEGWISFFFFWERGGGGNVDLNYFLGKNIYCILISYCFSPALPCYNQWAWNIKFDPLWEQRKPSPCGK